MTTLATFTLSAYILTAATLLTPFSTLASDNQCAKHYTAINEIQGTSAASPMQGKVVTTQGIVSHIIYPNSPMAGFSIQAEKAEHSSSAKPASNGLFIADPVLSRTVQLGQQVQLTGTVTEIDGMTSLTKLQQSQLCQTNVALKPTEIKLPLPKHLSWEQLEGQWLSFNQQLVVNDSYDLPRYGEITVAASRFMVPTEIMTPGHAANALYAQQQQQMLVIDDGLWQQNPDPVAYPSPKLSATNTLRIGDKVSHVTGILIEDKRGYKLVPTTPPNFIVANPRPEEPDAKPKHALRFASFNVLNYFNGSNRKKAFPTERGATTKAEFERQKVKIIHALAALDADVIGLLEVENNGYGKHSAIADLTNALNRASKTGPYQFIRSKAAPGDDAIKVAILYRPSTVKPVGKAALSFTAPFNQGSRVPLAQSFVHLASAETVTLSINHFKSKGSCNKQSDKADANNDDGQGCWNKKRVASSLALDHWLSSYPTGIKTNKQLILGDLNAYRMEDPVTALERAGWQHLAKPETAAYSYVYRGRTGSLDHALASPELAKHLQHIQHWAINADEPAALDYNLEYKSTSQQTEYFAPGPYRSSDHDPVIVTFMF